MPGVPRVLLVRVDQESAQIDRYAPRLSLGEPIETSEQRPPHFQANVDRMRSRAPCRVSSSLPAIGKCTGRVGSTMAGSLITYESSGRGVTIRWCRRP